MGNKAQHPRKALRSDAPPNVGAGALGGVCPRRWGQVLEGHLPVPSAPDRHGDQNRTLQAITGADLAERPASGVMDHLNWGYIQLGLVALAFGGLQVWWISSIFRRRELAGPLS